MTIMLSPNAERALELSIDRHQITASDRAAIKAGIEATKLTGVEITTNVIDRVVKIVLDERAQRNASETCEVSYCTDAPTVGIYCAHHHAHREWFSRDR